MSAPILLTVLFDLNASGLLAHYDQTLAGGAGATGVTLTDPFGTQLVNNAGASLVGADASWTLVAGTSASARSTVSINGNDTAIKSVGSTPAADATNHPLLLTVAGGFQSSHSGGSSTISTSATSWLQWTFAGRNRTRLNLTGGTGCTVSVYDEEGGFVGQATDPGSIDFDTAPDQVFFVRVGAFGGDVTVHFDGWLAPVLNHASINAPRGQLIAAVITLAPSTASHSGHAEDVGAGTFLCVEYDGADVAAVSIMGHQVASGQYVDIGKRTLSSADISITLDDHMDVTDQAVVEFSYADDINGTNQTPPAKLTIIVTAPLAVETVFRLGRMGRGQEGRLGR